MEYETNDRNGVSTVTLKNGDTVRISDAKLEVFRPSRGVRRFRLYTLLSNKDDRWVEVSDIDKIEEGWNV
jgi:hypothetical protein